MKKEKIIIPKEKVLKAKKPYFVPSFRSGRFMTKKDRPRDKSYKKWRKEDE